MKEINYSRKLENGELTSVIDKPCDIAGALKVVGYNIDNCVCIVGDGEHKGEFKPFNPKLVKLSEVYEYLKNLPDGYYFCQVYEDISEANGVMDMMIAEDECYK